MRLSVHLSRCTPGDYRVTGLCFQRFKCNVYRIHIIRRDRPLYNGRNPPVRSIQRFTFFLSNNNNLHSIFGIYYIVRLCYLFGNYCLRISSPLAGIQWGSCCRLLSSIFRPFTRVFLRSFNSRKFRKTIHYCIMIFPAVICSRFVVASSNFSLVACGLILLVLWCALHIL